MFPKLCCLAQGLNLLLGDLIKRTFENEGLFGSCFLKLLIENVILMFFKICFCSFNFMFSVFFRTKKKLRVFSLFVLFFLFFRTKNNFKNRNQTSP